MSASPAPESQSSWKEYKTDEGRIYWSHKTTKQSVWEKPDDLKTPFERALVQTAWKQYISKDRPYYVNSITKETKWNLPPDLVELKRKVDASEAYRSEKRRRKERGMSSPTPPPRSASPENLRPSNNNALAAYSARQRETSTPTAKPVETVFIPPGGFPNHEKAEEAFIYLLKRDGVDETWTWDQTMRKIIMDPLYKALETLAQKKAAFEKHINGILSERRAAKEARIERLRPMFFKMFDHSPEIKSYSTVKTASEIFKRDRHWREAQPEEQRMLLDEWTTEQRRKQETAERELRQRNLDNLSKLVRELDLNVSTRWRAAHEVILAAPSFRQNPELQKIETIDILAVWDDYSRQLEQEHEQETKRVRIERVRKARKAREGFVAFLHELKHDGHLTRQSKWKDLYPKIKKDERYENLLGLQGSSPLDLWMDVVDDMQDEVERGAEKVEQFLKQGQKVVEIETKWDEFEGWTADLTMDPKLKKDVYDFIHEELVQRAADEARRAERKRRHRMEDFRYALKKVQRIDIEMTYDEAEPFMKDIPEYEEMSPEDRRTAYEKFVKRQQEKLREEMEEGTSERERKSSRMDIDPSEDKDKDRRSKDKERDYERSKRDSYKDKDREGDRSREYRRNSDRKKRMSEEQDERDRETKRARRDSVVSNAKSRSESISKRDDDVEEGEI